MYIQIRFIGARLKTPKQFGFYGFRTKKTLNNYIAYLFSEYQPSLIRHLKRHSEDFYSKNIHYFRTDRFYGLKEMRRGWVVDISKYQGRVTYNISNKVNYWMLRNFGGIVRPKSENYLYMFLPNIVKYLSNRYGAWSSFFERYRKRARIVETNISRKVKGFILVKDGKRSKKVGLLLAYAEHKPTHFIEKTTFEFFKHKLNETLKGKRMGAAISDFIADFVNDELNKRIPLARTK